MTKREELEELIEKRKRQPMKKKNGTHLLNWYNTLLSEYFNTKELVNNTNRGIFNKFSEDIENTYDIDFIKFMGHIILNWEQYQKNYYAATGIPYPALRFIYKNAGIFVSVYNKLNKGTKEQGGIEKW